jgi:hypothetical protein
VNNLDDLLNNTDFSQNSTNKAAIKAMLLNKLKYKERKNYSRGAYMKKNRIRPYAVAAAITVTVLIAACSAFYAEDIKNVIQQFTVGQYATYVSYDNSGDIVRSSTGEAQVRLNNAGDEFSVAFTGAVFTYEAEIEQEKGLVTYFETIDDVKPYLAFNPLMSVYLPIGFTLDRISLYNDENGLPLPLGSNMYLNVYYTDVEKTKQIYVQLRLMNEQNAFVASAGNDMRHISINGHDGVVESNNVHVEIDGVMYMILAGRAEGVTQDDVIRMAKSLQ